MVLSVCHPYDTVEVLGVFTDIDILKQVCHSLIYKESELIEDIGNLHIYRCPVNKMIGEFYPLDYDDPNSTGTYMEEEPLQLEKYLAKNLLTVSFEIKEKR